MGATYPIRTIMLCPRNEAGAYGEGFPVDFQIEVSTDNVNWTVYVKRVGYSNPGSTAVGFGPPYGYDGIDARYIRVTSTNLDTVGGLYLMQFAEIEAYTYAQPNPYNRVLGKTITTSSSDESSGWSASHLIDGISSQYSEAMGWRSSSNLSVNHTEWAKIDLGSTFSNVSQVLINSTGNGNGFPVDFKIELSTDNNNWTTVFSRTNYPNPSYVKGEFFFNKTTARYVRVTGTKLQNISGEAYRMAFTDIQVYNEAENPTYIGSTDYTMECIEGSSSPLIDRNHSNSSGNNFGYETGHVIKLSNGEYHMAVNEMYSTGWWFPTKIAHWKSTNGTTWTRLGTISPDFGGDLWNPHSGPWDPQWYWDDLTNKWNVTYVSNGSYGGMGIRLQSNNTGDAGITEPYSTVQMPFGLNHNTIGPYWMQSMNQVSLSNIYTVGSTLYTFAGGSNSMGWYVGLASASSINGPWTMNTTNKKPTLVHAENPVVTVLDDGTYFCVFDEINNGFKTLGYAYSFDGVNWIQKSCSVTVSWASTQDAVHSVRTPMSVIKDADGNYEIYFCARDVDYTYWNVGKVKVKINKYNYAASTLLADDFSGDLSKWEDTGSVSTSNGRMVVTNHETMRSAAGGSNWTNYTYEANVKINNSAAGLAFRIQNDNNYYMWQLSASGNLYPHKKVNGNWTLIKTVPAGLTSDRFYNVKIVASNSTIYTYIDGILVDTTTDSAFSSGKVGFRQYGSEAAEYDNILVERLTCG